VIGTPTEDDKLFVTDHKAFEYLNTFPKRERLDLKTLYPGAGEEALDFLSKTLVFNPYFRISLEDCFNHPFFEKVRKEEKENIEGKPVTLDFEKEELNKDRLRKLFLEEINYFQELNKK